nr:sensor histidine kinase [uncultured Pedobacter sp.]
MKIFYFSLFLGCLFVFNAKSQSVILNHNLNDELKSAKTYISSGNADSAKILLNEVIKTAQKKNDTKVYIEAKLALGRMEADRGNNVMAFKLYQEALLKAESINDKSFIAHTYKNIGALYISWKKFTEALDYYNKAEVLAREVNEDELIADCQNNKGTVYEQLLLYDKAIIAYKNAYDIYLAKDITPKIAMALSNLAIVYKYEKKYDASLKYNFKAIELSVKTGDEWMQAATYNNIGNLYGEIGNYQLAIKYCERALEISKKISAIEIIESTYDSMSDAAKRAGDYKMALAYQKLFTEYNKKFINEENTKQLSELNVKFETEKKQKLIQQQQFEISRKNQWLYGSLIFLFLGLVVFYLVIRNNKYKQDKKLQLEILKQQDLASKAILEAEEKERKRIASDLHDGLGQMFSTVKLNLSGLENQVQFKDKQVKTNFFKTMDLVDVSCKELRNISHQMASDVLMKLGMVAAIRDFIQNINQDKLKVNFQSVNINERIPSNIETVLYRVVQESVNNVIKHAKASNLDIQLLKEEHELTLIIEDNGVGFDVKEIGNAAGIGLQNIKSRIEYLRGTIDFDSAKNRGTVISIYVPLG